MANKVTAAKAKVGGAIYYASTTPTTVPSDASTALDAAFVSLGYVSEDGVTNDNSPSSETIKAWGGDTVLTVQSDRPDTFTFKLIEAMDTNVQKFVYGASNVSTGKITATNDELGAFPVVIEMITKGNKAKRIYIPSARVTSVGSIAYKDNEAIGYEITLTAEVVYDTTEQKNVTHYEFMAS